MIPDNLTKKAVRAVLGHLRKKFRGLAGNELRSAAGLGVARAAQEYEADRTDAAYLWLKIAGTQRAINALREDGFLDKRCAQHAKGTPQNPKRAADLSSSERDQFGKATASEGDSPFPLDLFNHPCLTKSERAVLLDRYAENHTWDEVAEHLGIPERTCRRRHDKAIEKLRRVLGEEKTR